MSKPPEHRCGVCSAPAKKICAGCQNVWYCSAACQKQAWKAGHREKCKAAQAAAPPAAVVRRRAALLTAEQRAKVPEETCMMLFDGTTATVGPSCYWLRRWQPDSGSVRAPGLIPFCSHFESPADTGGTAGNAGGATGVTQFIFGADQQAWLWLEAEDMLGPRPKSEVLRVPNAANAARLRQLLAATPWWVALHEHSPRLIREFCPFAVALLLDRADWLTAEEAAARELLHHLARVCGVQRDTSLHPGQLVITDMEPALLPLLKAALFVPSSPFCQDVFVVAGEGVSDNSSGAGPARAAALLAATHSWAADSPPQSLPTVVYESARQWADITSAADPLNKHRGGGSMQSVMLLDLVTLLAKHGEGAETLFVIMGATAQGRLGVMLKPGDGDEVSLHAQITTDRGLDGGAHASRSGCDAVWKMREDWVITMPVGLGMEGEINGRSTGGSATTEAVLRQAQNWEAVDATAMSRREMKRYLDEQGVRYGDCVETGDFRALVAATAERDFRAREAATPCNSELYYAVEVGDAPKVEAILRRMLSERPAGAPPFASGVEAAAFFEGPNNSLEVKGTNYLSLAAQLGRGAVIEVLCDVGGYCATELQPSPGCSELKPWRSILLTACLNKNVGAVRALIKRGVPCDSVDPEDNCAAIHNTICNNKVGSHVGVARELLTNPLSAAATKASLTLCQPPGLPALFFSAARNELEMIELLIEHGATIPETPVPPDHPLRDAFALSLLKSRDEASTFDHGVVDHGVVDHGIVVAGAAAMNAAMHASLRDTAYLMMHSSWSNQLYEQPGVGSKNLEAARHQGRVIDLMLRHCPPTSRLVHGIIDALPRPRSNDGSVDTGSRACANCPKQGKVKCGACAKVRYCSKQCQKQHWKVHKKDCKK